MLVNVNDINWYEYLLSFGLVEPTKNKRKRIKQRIINVFTAFEVKLFSNISIALNSPVGILYTSILFCIITYILYHR